MVITIIIIIIIIIIISIIITVIWLWGCQGYRGIMGAIRDIDVHCSGKALAAVGLGRFAYVFPTVALS